MKCVCGYEYDMGYYDEDFADFINGCGDEKFIEIDGINEIEHGDGKIKLIACPKCQTIKFVYDWEDLK